MADPPASPPEHAVPSVTTRAAPMQRTTSEHIREERQDLKLAADKSLNVILDLGTDGAIRWVSPSWEEVVGTTVSSVQGKQIAELLIDDDNKTVFSTAISDMRQDDSKSKFIHFSIPAGPKSRLRPRQPRLEGEESGTESQEETPHVLELEGQGILVYDRATGQESHVSVTATSRPC